MSELLPDGTRKLALSRERYGAIQKKLRSFFQQTKCGVVMVSDSSGLAVVTSGAFSPDLMALLSTLAAGNHAATAEMAKLVGDEQGFNSVFHEGRKNSLYITAINSDFLLVVVFDRHCTFGMIRVLAAKLIDELKEILNNQTENSQQAAGEVEISRTLAGSEFQEELGSRLESVLFQKNNG